MIWSDKKIAEKKTFWRKFREKENEFDIDEVDKLDVIANLMKNIPIRTPKSDSTPVSALNFENVNANLISLNIIENSEVSEIKSVDKIPLKVKKNENENRESTGSEIAENVSIESLFSSEYIISSDKNSRSNSNSYLKSTLSSNTSPNTSLSSYSEISKGGHSHKEFDDENETLGLGENAQDFNVSKRAKDVPISLNTDGASQKIGIMDFNVGNAVEHEIRIKATNDVKANKNMIKVPESNETIDSYHKLKNILKLDPVPTKSPVKVKKFITNKLKGTQSSFKILQDFKILEVANLNHDESSILNKFKGTLPPPKSLDSLSPPPKIYLLKGPYHTKSGPLTPLILQIQPQVLRSLNLKEALKLNLNRKLHFKEIQTGRSTLLKRKGRRNYLGVH